MAYTRTNWVSGETPLSATNMNNIEDGIEELNSKIVFEQTTVTYTNGWTTINKSGYFLLALYAMREDNNYSISINKRSSAGGYILISPNAGNTSQVVQAIWIKNT